MRDILTIKLRRDREADSAAPLFTMQDVLLRAVLIAVLVVLPRAGAAQPTVEDDPVTVLTLNIWHNQDDWPARLNLIVETLEDVRPDVILLQEVLQNEELPNQAASIAYRLGYEDYHFASVDPEGASKRYGNAILSRHPFLEKNARSLDPANDYRVAAHARIDVDGRPLNVYSTHLHYSADEPGTAVRTQQIEDLLDFVEATREGAPVIVGGDFNTLPEAPEMELLREHYVDALAGDETSGTLNAAKGHSPRRIDYLFAGPQVEVLEADILFDRPGPDSLWASDHFGVMGSFGLDRAAFVEDLQRRTFDWFWEETNPSNGLTPDRAPSRPFASIAAVGFALTAYPVGVERGYITREQARERTLNTLEFFWNAPQDTAREGVTGHRGFFYHFLDLETGERYRTTELSTIDTALLMGGVLFAGEYFDQSNRKEARIRAYADSLYRRVEWDWFQREDGLITMAWRPERGFSNHAYEGYDEAMLLYLLAMGSPTHPIDPKAWDAFTSTYRWEPFYGIEHVNFSPLFGHQYSHVWIDFRDIQDAYMRDKGIDYFENSRRATQAQRRYGIDNPNGFEDYSGDIWGWTASDGPAGTWAVIDGDSIRFRTYWARGVSAGDIRDDGTVAPTAAGGSIPFAPEITLAALEAMREKYGDLVYNEYGFVDAFNPTFRHADAEPNRGIVDPEHGWFDGDQLGIDQGPIVLMLENYRSGLIWDVMRRSDIIRRGLCRAGFTGGWIREECN